MIWTILDIAEAKSSESTLKRNNGTKKQSASTHLNLQNVPSLNLKYVKPANFHDEFMEIWKEF